MSDLSPDLAEGEWGQWATFANHVSEALRATKGPHMLFSNRCRLAVALWEMGYRPTEPQVQAEIARQRRVEAARRAEQGAAGPEGHRGPERPSESHSRSYGGGS